MINPVHPSLIFILAALALPLLRARILKQALLLAVPLIALADLMSLPPGQYWTYRFMTYDLVLGRVDSLSICFAYVFVVMAFLGTVYALHVKEEQTQAPAAALLYAGGTLGVTLAGDFFTLFAFWELMAFSSVFLIWLPEEQAGARRGIQIPAHTPLRRRPAACRHCHGGGRYRLPRVRHPADRDGKLNPDAARIHD